MASSTVLLQFMVILTAVVWGRLLYSTTMLSLLRTMRLDTPGTEAFQTCGNVNPCPGEDSPNAENDNGMMDSRMCKIVIGAILKYRDESLSVNFSFNFN